MIKSPFRLLGPGVCLAILSTSAATAGEQLGSGVAIDAHGDILTAAHVVDKCSAIQVAAPLRGKDDAELIARDAHNDIALLRAKHPLTDFVAIRMGVPSHVGETAIAVGYPLAGLLSSEAKVSTGIVSAAAGIEDDVRYYQVTVPVQPGNSGGPLLDQSGHLIGIVAAKLDFRIVGLTGALPENVNFAVKSDMAALFLNSFGVQYRADNSSRPMTVSAIMDQASRFTVQVRCQIGAETIAQSPPHKRHASRPAKSNSLMRKMNPDWFKQQ